MEYGLFVALLGFALFGVLATVGSGIAGKFNFLANALK